ncbi:54S ribosomal protein L2 [Colletotrichum sidae]|nr:54S ribosomal protein L2 [Colletotrichum sidae]
MRLFFMQQPLRVAAAGLLRPTTTPTSLAAAANALVAGRRYASVKSQGAYKLAPKRTIPKKLGAKRTGDQYVIPGNIIYKQRGTLWWPGENCIMGRDHTIHAMASGYVKYYRDPARHPDRKYIGVVYNKDDVLPYPAHAERKRKLNMSAHPISKPVEPSALSPSGIPTTIVRRVTKSATGKKGGAPEPPRVLRLRDDFSYREDNWRIGRLVKLNVGGMSRRAKFRHRRWAKEKTNAGQKAAAAKFAAMEVDEWTIAAAKRLQEQRNAADRAKNLKKKNKAAKAAKKAQKQKRRRGLSKRLTIVGLGIQRRGRFHEDDEAQRDQGQYQAAWVSIGHVPIDSQGDCLVYQPDGNISDHDADIRIHIAGAPGELSCNVDCADILPSSNAGTPETDQPSHLAQKKPALSLSSRIQDLQESWEASNVSNSNALASDGVSALKDSLNGEQSLSASSLTRTQPKKLMGSSQSAPSPSSMKRVFLIQGGQPKRQQTSQPSGDPITAADIQLVEDIFSLETGSMEKLRRRADAVLADLGAPAATTETPFIPISQLAVDDDDYEDDSTDEEDDDDVNDDDDEEMADDDVIAAVVSEETSVSSSESQAATPTPPEDPLVELTRTNDNSRPYAQWYGAWGGKLENTAGALLPTGYEIHTDPAYPFICPVRDCRTLFNKMKALSPHFLNKHKSSMFNDNLDGTLTFIDYYRKADNAERYPPIIVSRRPPLPDEPPEVPPRLPGYKPVGHPSRAPSASAANARIQRLNQARSARSAAESSPLRQVTELVSDHRASSVTRHTSVREYLVAQLSPNYRLAVERPDIKFLLKRPLKRELPSAWRAKHAGIDGLTRQAALALLVHITGDPAPRACLSCTVQTAHMDNLLHPCIVLPANTPDWLKQTVSEECASCQWRSSYQGLKNLCDFLPVTRRLRAASTSPSPLPSSMARPSISSSAPVSQAPPRVSSLAGQPARTSYPAPPKASMPPPPLRRPTIETAVPVPCIPLPTTESVHPGIAANGKKANSPPRRVTRYSAVTAKMGAADASKTPAASQRLSSSSREDNAMPAELLEMEDWEVAPGRVRDEDNTFPTNVAFSNAYLTTNQAVTVSEDIAFNVLVIKPGASHQWTEEDDKIRICSLAVGKVHVKLDQTEPFQIGPNGMFKLKPSVACTVENRLYIDAVIHVTSVAQY